MINKHNPLNWPVKAYGRIVQGDESTPGKLIAEAETEAMATKIAKDWNQANAKNQTKLQRVKRWLVDGLKIPVILFTFSFLSGLGIFAGVLSAIDLGPLISGKAVIISVVDMVDGDEETAEDNGETQP